MAVKQKQAVKQEHLLPYHPLTVERWDDFETLFGPRGAYGGCWCMWWRTTRSQFERQKGEGNRLALKALVEAGEIPGILLYDDGQPVGWCSVAPRESYASLNRSRVLKPIDETPVCSVVCFYIPPAQRGRGILLQLIKAAVDYVRRQGGRLIEAYPTRPRGRNLAPVSSFMGLPSVFQQAGFVECARPSPSKVIMRCVID